MEEPTPITPELRENLVAYLDGELDEVATLDVERTLSESAEIRQEVEALSRTWELLDELPHVRASSQFTERTMASVQAASAELTQPLLNRNIRRQLLWISLVAGAVLCAAGGFLLANRAIPQRSDALVRDLPVIEHFDLYVDVGEVEFLRDLQQSEILTDGPTAEFQNGDN